MGQTVSSQIDYTFGIIADYSEAGTSSKYQRIKQQKQEQQQEQCVTVLNKRILLYPEQYGFIKDTYPIEDNQMIHMNNNKENETPLCIDLSLTNALSLSPSSSSSPSSPSSPIMAINKQIDRIDSGYGDEDGFYSIKAPSLSPSPSFTSSNLIEDISYVDEIYYSDFFVQQEKEQSNTDHNQHHESPNIENGIHFTFAAAAAASQDVSMRDIYLPRRSLIHLSENIGLLTSLRKLDLYNNRLETLPDSIGQLKQLEILILSKNQIQQLPDSIQYLSRLIELDVSFNKLKEIKSLGNFTLLSTLLLSNNLLESLPSDVSGMKQIVTIDLSNNPIKVLPAEIIRLSHLRRLKLEQCQYILNIDPDNAMEYETIHNPPSLVEICARKLMSSTKKKDLIQKNKHLLKLLPEHLLTYLGTAKVCSSCHGPYFESYVLRGRLLEKPDTWIPLEYRLCTAHWSDENDRLLNLFHQETTNLTQRYDDLKSNIHLVHKLLGFYQQEEVVFIDDATNKLLLSSRRLSCIDNNMDDLDTASKLSSFVRHPQRLQKVMNRNPSSFLLSKIQRK
ncbi:unnamed protein product [Cunninghamella blakesleeana]